MEEQLFLILVQSLFNENTSRSVPVLRYSILQAVRRALYVKRLASMLMSICLLCLEFGSIRNFNVLMVWTNHGWYMKLRQGSPKVAMSTGTYLRFSREDRASLFLGGRLETFLPHCRT